MFTPLPPPLHTLIDYLITSLRYAALDIAASPFRCLACRLVYFRHDDATIDYAAADMIRYDTLLLRLPGYQIPLRLLSLPFAAFTRERGEARERWHY